MARKAMEVVVPKADDVVTFSWAGTRRVAGVYRAGHFLGVMDNTPQGSKTDAELCKWLEDVTGDQDLVAKQTSTGDEPVAFRMLF